MKALALVLCVAVVGFPVLAQDRTVTDMVGRVVTLPAEVQRVATVGSVPVMNGMLFVVGAGDKLVNGLPQSMRTPRWKYQSVFAPNQANLPTMQGTDGATSAEELLKAAPDVVFTMDQKSAETLATKGLKTVCLSWTQPDDAKEVMRLLGEIFHQQTQAEAYVRYFDQTIDRVWKVTQPLSQDQRPRFLYCSVPTLTEPHLIVEWWATVAGGTSVTNNGRKTEAFPFSQEQLLAWNPDFLVVATPPEVKLASTNEIFLTLNAVKNKKVFVAPVGAHTWANRTVEQPLTVLWAAKMMHPDLFADVDLAKETKGFYKTFFGKELTDTQVAEILSGTL